MPNHRHHLPLAIAHLAGVAVLVVEEDAGRVQQGVRAGQCTGPLARTRSERLRCYLISTPSTRSLTGAHSRCKSADSLAATLPTTGNAKLVYGSPVQDQATATPEECVVRENAAGQPRSRPKTLTWLRLGHQP